jgi:hypothetical protein
VFVFSKKPYSKSKNLTLFFFFFVILNCLLSQNNSGLMNFLMGLVELNSQASDKKRFQHD